MKGPLGIRVNALAPGETGAAILSPSIEKLVQSIQEGWANRKTWPSGLTSR